MVVIIPNNILNVLKNKRDKYLINMKITAPIGKAAKNNIIPNKHPQMLQIHVTGVSEIGTE